MPALPSNSKLESEGMSESILDSESDWLQVSEDPEEAENAGESEDSSGSTEGKLRQSNQSEDDRLAGASRDTSVAETPRDGMV